MATPLDLVSSGRRIVYVGCDATSSHKQGCHRTEQGPSMDGLDGGCA